MQFGFGIAVVDDPGTYPRYDRFLLTCDGTLVLCRLVRSDDYRDAFQHGRLGEAGA
jgi:hypothetical protein